MSTRIYVVTDQVDKSMRLVDATTRHSAVAHVAKSRYTAVVAKSRDVALLMHKGVVVEDAAAVEEDTE